MKCLTARVLFSFSMFCMLALPIKVQGGLIGNWNFNEGSGSVASDSSGNENHGTVYGANWVTGVLGTALLFDGVDDYVEIADSSQLQLTDSLIVAAWVKRVDGEYLNILYKGPGADGPVNYEFDIDENGRLFFGFFNGDWNYSSRSSVGSISADIWHEVAVVYDGQQVRY